MYAIVDIAGQQFKVTKAQKLKVHRLEAEEGKQVELDKVLLLSDGKTTTIGTPTVEGVRVAATVISHTKGDKVLIFKKKRRKGYQTLNGHRQYITELWIEAILAKGEKFDASKSSAPKPVVKVDQPAKKVKVVKTETAEAPAAKAAAPKKAAAKKAAPKKAAAKKAAPKKDDKK